MTLYPESNLQTTINAMILRRPYRTTDEDRNIIATAIEAVSSVLVGYQAGDYSITLARPIANRDSVLSPGFPSEDLFNLRERVLQSCRDAEVPVVAPWGSQIVVARWRKPESGEKYLPVFDLLKDHPESVVSRIVSVDVIENIMDEHGQFECVVHASFSL